MRRALSLVPLLLVANPSVARADGEVLHSYVAPAGCPDASELRARLESASRQVDVVIDAPLGKTGRFTVSGGGTREVRGKDCGEVLAQLTFGIGLALDLPREQAPKPQDNPPPAPPRPTVVTPPEERDASAPPPTSPSWSARRELSIGAFAGHFSDARGDGFTFGGQLLLRRSLFAGGGVVEYGAGRERLFGGGVQLGVSLPTPSWLRVDVLGTLGAHGYASRSSHDAKTLGFLDARASVAYDYSQLSVGVSASAESDLAALASDESVQNRFTFGPFAAMRLDL